MPTEKIIFGIPGYGRSFRLANGEQNDILAPAYGAGPQGIYIYIVLYIPVCKSH